MSGNSGAAIAATILGVIALIDALGGIGYLATYIARIDAFLSLTGQDDQADDVLNAVKIGFYIGIAAFGLSLLAASLNIAAGSKRTSFGLWIAAAIVSTLVAVAFAAMLGIVLTSLVFSSIFLAIGLVPCLLCFAMAITDGVGAYQLRTEQVHRLKSYYNGKQRKQLDYPDYPRDPYNPTRGQQYKQTSTKPSKSSKSKSTAPSRRPKMTRPQRKR